MEIRQLFADHAEAWWTLRLEALQTDPLAFGKTVEEHQATTVEDVARRFRAPLEESFTVGAFENGSLIGMATFVRQTGRKERHKGHIYGVYVTPSRRRAGVGSALIAGLIDTAGRDQSLEQILLVTSQESAHKLYRRLGFTSFGTEPRALKVESTYVDEEHMILRLR